MKINDTIRQRRKAMDWTQERVAERLGVSASAVHKWETGASYPDITLLPPLARLLGVDLNTLLSFREDLTDREVGFLVSDLRTLMDREGYEAGFDTAMETLREYPASGFLAGTVAAFLDGAQSFYPPKDPTVHADAIEALYRQAAQSDRPEMRDLANYMLVFKHADRGQWTQAEELLETLPNPSGCDQTTVRTALLMRQEKYDEAAKLLEGRLFGDLIRVHSLLLNVLILRLKEGDTADADQIADLIQKMAELFGLSPYTAQTAYFELALHRKDADACLDLLDAMLDVVDKPAAYVNSPLFRHLNHNTDSGLLRRMGASLATSLNTDTQLGFLRDHPNFHSLMEKYKACGET